MLLERTQLMVGRVIDGLHLVFSDWGCLIAMDLLLLETELARRVAIDIRRGRSHAGVRAGFNEAFFFRLDHASMHQYFCLSCRSKAFLFSFLLLLFFHAEHAHELVSYESECFLVSREHEVMNIAPCLTIIDIFRKLVNRSPMNDSGFRSALGPRSHLEVVPARL